MKSAAPTPECFGPERDADRKFWVGFTICTVKDALLFSLSLTEGAPELRYFFYVPGPAGEMRSVQGSCQAIKLTTVGPPYDDMSCCR